MNLFEDRTEVLLPGTGCTVVSYAFDFVEYVRFSAAGSISVAFENVRGIITNPWVANQVNGEWVVTRKEDGRAHFFDWVTHRATFTPYHEADEAIRQFLSGKLKAYDEGQLVEATPLPHQGVIHAASIGGRPT